MNQENSGLIDGIIISLFEDFGPSNIFNSSPLSHVEALNVAVKGMTTLGTETAIEKGEIRSYGPIPTPRDPYVTIGFFLTLDALQSEDVRIRKTGRLVVFWIITRSNKTVSYISIIKKTIRRILRIYKIKTDEDLRNEDVLLKIGTKFKIIETGVEPYYLTPEKNVEPFTNLALVSDQAPLVIIDNNSKKIDLLIREKTTPTQKMDYIRIVNEFKNKMPKGALYKVEAITESLTIQRILSKEGLILRQDYSDHLRIRLTDKISFDEINEFLDHQLTPVRDKIASNIIQTFDKKMTLDLNELALQTGLSEKFLHELMEYLIKSNILPNAIIENDILRFN